MASIIPFQSFPSVLIESRKQQLFPPTTLLSFLTDSSTFRPQSTTFDSSFLNHKMKRTRSTSCDPIPFENPIGFADGQGDSPMPFPRLSKTSCPIFSGEGSILESDGNNRSLLFPSTEVLSSSSQTPTVLSTATELPLLDSLDQPLASKQDIAIQVSPAELPSGRLEQSREVNVTVTIKKETKVKSLLKTVPVYISRGQVKRRFVVQDPNGITNLWGVRLGGSGETVLRDRRLIVALNRYPGSVAELVAREREFRKLGVAGMASTAKFFLYLQTTSWDQMRWLVRDLEHEYPEWGLARQLTR